MRTSVTARKALTYLLPKLIEGGPSDRDLHLLRRVTDSLRHDYRMNYEAVYSLASEVVAPAFLERPVWDGLLMQCDSLPQEGQ